MEEELDVFVRGGGMRGISLDLECKDWLVLPGEDLTVASRSLCLLEEGEDTEEVEGVCVRLALEMMLEGEDANRIAALSLVGERLLDVRVYLEVLR